MGGTTRRVPNKALTLVQEKMEGVVAVEKERKDNFDVNIRGYLARGTIVKVELCGETVEIPS